MVYILRCRNSNKFSERPLYKEECKFVCLFAISIKLQFQSDLDEILHTKPSKQDEDQGLYKISKQPNLIIISGENQFVLSTVEFFYCHRNIIKLLFYLP